MQSSGGRRNGRLRLGRVAALAGLALAAGFAAPVAPAGAGVAVPVAPGPGPVPLPPHGLTSELRSAPVVEQGTVTPPSASPPVPEPVPPTEPPPAAEGAHEGSRVGEPSAGAEADAAAARSTGRRSRSSTAPGAVVPPAPAPAPVDTATPVVAVEESTVERLRRATVPAARDFGFPLALGLLVLGFLSVQGRLDRRDPKLAVAPVSMDDDLLPFA